MADDVIGNLGLNVSDFNKAAQSADAQMRYLDAQAKQLDATIKILERDILNGGKATGAQTAQLGQLRQALKGVTDDYKAVKAQKVAFDNITGNSAEDKKRRKEEEKEQAKTERTWKSAIASAIGFNLTIAGAIIGLKRLAESVLTLGQRSIEAQQKYTAGGSRLSANTADRNVSAESISLQTTINNLVDSAKKEVATASGKAIKGLEFIYTLISKGQTGVDQMIEGDVKRLKSARELLALNDELVSSQDKLGKELENQTPDSDSKLRILRLQLDIAEKQEAIAANENNQDRQAVLAAQAAQGEIKAQMAAIGYEQKKQVAQAEAEVTALQLKQKGYDRIGQLIKMQTDYELQINDARRSGNVLLADQILKMKEMATLGIRVQEHNMTARDRLSERSSARKFDRDVRKTVRQTADLDKSLANAFPGVDPSQITDDMINDAEAAGKITRGSRLDRYARRGAANRIDQKNIGNRMSVNTFQATNAVFGSYEIPNK